jgi:hypothetical protein
VLSFSFFVFLLLYIKRCANLINKLQHNKKESLFTQKQTKTGHSESQARFYYKIINEISVYSFAAFLSFFFADPASVPSVPATWILFLASCGFALSAPLFYHGQ